MRECADSVFFFQAEDGIRDLVRSRGLGDVYKRQGQSLANEQGIIISDIQSGTAAYGLSAAGREQVRTLSLIHI